MKALLVEDNPADARLIREMLKEAPAGVFEVEQAGRLDSALERLRQQAFDIVLLDLGLPDSQGMETLIRMRQASDGLPVVVLTGLDDEQFALEAVRAGAQDYLVKGRLDAELLVRTIRYAVQRKEAEEEVRRLNAELERRVAERTAALDVVARKFASMFDTTSDGVWIHNLQGQILEVNDAYCRMSGYARDEILGKPISLVEAYESPEQIAQHITKVLQRGGHDRFESRHRRRNGSIFDVDVTALFLNIEDGRIAIFVRDITERKRAEETLQVQRQLLEAVLNQVPTAVLLLEGADLRMRLANPAYQALAPGKQMAGKRFEEVWPEIGSEVPGIFRRVLATGEPHTATDELFMIRRTPGSPLEPAYFSWSVSRLRLPGDEGWALLNTAWETTERKRSEEALRQAEAAAREATHRLQALMEAVPVGISFSDDLTCRRITGNPAALAQFDVNAEDNLSASGPDAAAPGRQVQFFQDGHEITDAELPLQRAVAENRVISPSELEVLLPSGRRWFCDASGAPVRDADGKVFAGIAVTVDITGRKLAEEALVRAEKLAAVGRMAATIAHEINNPLAAVMNSLYIARTNAGSPEMVRHYLRIADEELQRIAYLTRQSLGFYRESAAPAPACLDDILISAIDLLKSKAIAKRVNIHKECDRRIHVHAVPGELRQVFANLLVNSLDASEEGGIIKIRASTWRDASGNSSVRITVADNGAGVGPDALPHLFEPFFTTKQAGGTGLGLWVTKQIIEKHSGAIRVHSRTTGARRGTTFSLVLPDSVPAARTQSAGRD